MESTAHTGHAMVDSRAGVLEKKGLEVFDGEVR
jgi:hypothetical protein